MSLAELLPAIRALPRAEQVQLLHLLIDGVAEAPEPTPSAATDEIPEHLREMFLPGVTPELWMPERYALNPEGWAVIEAALAEMKRGTQ